MSNILCFVSAKLLNASVLLQVLVGFLQNLCYNNNNNNNNNNVFI